MKRTLAVILLALVTLFAGGAATANSFNDRDWQGGPPDCC